MTSRRARTCERSIAAADIRCPSRASVEHDPRHGRIRQYRQVRAILRRSQIADGGAVAQAFARRILQIESAFVAAIVVICQPLETRFGARAEKASEVDRNLSRLVQWIGPPRPRTAGSPSRKILEALEYRQHVRIAPAVAALSRP